MCIDNVALIFIRTMRKTSELTPPLVYVNSYPSGLARGSIWNSYLSSIVVIASSPVSYACISYKQNISHTCNQNKRLSLAKYEGGPQLHLLQAWEKTRKKSIVSGFSKGSTQEGGYTIVGNTDWSVMLNDMAGEIWFENSIVYG